MGIKNLIVEAAHHAVANGGILEEDISHITEDKIADEGITGS